MVRLVTSIIETLLSLFFVFVFVFVHEETTKFIKFNLILFNLAYGERGVALLSVNFG